MKIIRKRIVAIICAVIDAIKMSKEELNETYLTKAEYIKYLEKIVYGEDKKSA